MISIRKAITFIMSVAFLSGCTLDTDPFVTVVGESIVLAGTYSSNLLHTKIKHGSIIVRNTYSESDEDCIYYKENIDFIVDYDNGLIMRTSNSSIPDYSANILYGIDNFKHGDYPGYGNKPFFVFLDYESEDLLSITSPSDQSLYLENTKHKLVDGGEFKIVSYGDSITAGGEASVPERQFNYLYTEYLKIKYPKANITLQDVSIPGYCSTQAIAWFTDKIGPTQPDLVLIGFGMNDHNINSVEPDQFRINLIELVRLTKTAKNCDVLLYSCFPPNDKWYYGTHRMSQYNDATRNAAIETNSAYVDVYSVWEKVLKRKDIESLLANNINHPNDFGHYLYFLAFRSITF
jgi:lysophospholipase L1-like esterase